MSGNLRLEASKVQKTQMKRRILLTALLLRIDAGGFWWRRISARLDTSQCDVLVLPLSMAAVTLPLLRDSFGAIGGLLRIITSLFELAKK